MISERASSKHPDTSADTSPGLERAAGLANCNEHSIYRDMNEQIAGILRSSKSKLYCEITHMSRERTLDLIAQKY
jgi:hypothetical protein